MVGPMNRLIGSCVIAAERVHFLLGRDRDQFFPHFLSKLSCSDLLANKCDLVKIPKIPSHVERIPLYGVQMHRFSSWRKKLDGAKKEKIDLSAKEKSSGSQIDRSALQTQCCVNQKTPYLHFEETCAANDLTAVRVFDWRFKEHFLVSRKLRNLHKGRPPVEKQHNFVPINPQKNKADSSRDQEFWAEMIRAKEKPIFQQVQIK